MTISEDTQTNSVYLTQPAAEAIRNIIEEKKLQGHALRVFVQGGGCSGIQYGLAFDNNIRPTDITSETDGIKLFCDEVSIKYLAGATVDYFDSPEGSGFRIDNPNPLPSTYGCSNTGGCSGCH